jgi:hypothetical protein
MLVIKIDNGTVYTAKATLAGITLDNDNVIFDFVGNVDGRRIRFDVSVMMGVVVEKLELFIEKLYDFVNYYGTITQNTLNEVVGRATKYATK